MTHGQYAEGDDFVFLESYRGRLYTWLGGRVAEFDPSGEGNWLRSGPEGVNCYGAAVAGDWLMVAIASRYAGDFEVWGFSLYEHGRDGVWRPQRDFVFGAGGPGPRP